MGLDAELRQKAKDLYQWEIEFKGEPLQLLRREHIAEEAWISGILFPRLALGVLPLDCYTRYGFINISDPEKILYQPLVKIHSSRANDYQKDLLSAALSTLRRDLSGAATIRLPAELQKIIGKEHLELLLDQRERLRGRGDGEVPIYDTSSPRVRTAVIDQLYLFEPD